MPSHETIKTSPGGSAAPAWSDPELRDLHTRADKPGRVRRMFAAIAGSYDLNNRVHSLGRDQAWRRFAVRAAGVKRGDRVLDVACGTGDLSQAFAATDAAEIVGVDFTPEMLAIAAQKRDALGSPTASRVRYQEGDAQNLAFSDASFDVVSIAFGIRNVADPARALSEFARVLRPGGRLVILEFDRPSTPPMSWFYDFYCGTVMPRTATLISGDKSGAYKYLPKSVGSFMTRNEMRIAIERAGFSDVTSTPLSLGICMCYRAVRS